MFLYTGDRRYLRPIPMALDWMESSVIGIDDRGRPEFAKWYDPETNYPITKEFLPEFTPEGYMKYRYTPDSTITFVNFTGTLSYREQYEKVRDVEPGKEREMYRELFEEDRQNRSPGEDRIRDLITSMDEKGAWIESFTVHDIARTMEPNFESVRDQGSYLYAVKELQGISTRTYMRNMRHFIGYLKQGQ
jgi:hypothetical protein